MIYYDVTFLCNVLSIWTFRVDNGRVKLKTIGQTCQVEVQNAHEKDKGVWDFYVGIGDNFFNRKHVFYTVHVKGNRNVLGLSWFWPLPI